MATTYSQLVQDVKTYLERADQSLVDQIPQFIQLAEIRLSREVENLGYLKFVTSNFQAGQPVYQKPTGWRRSAYLNFGSGTGNRTRNTIFKRDYAYLRDFWPDPSETGDPQYYADYGYTHFLVAPTPQSTNPFEFGYYELPQPLSESNQTNWTTQYAQDLLLYATLLETAPFLKNDERIPIWQAMYDRASRALLVQDQNRTVDSQSAAKA